MAKLADIVAYCDKRTDRASFEDAPGAFNGLQVANRGLVAKIGAAVDAGVIPFQRAVAAEVDFLIVHHGMFWDMPRPLTGPTYERVSTLIEGNCALYSNHLPLDSHREIGNNALLAKQLGLAATRGFMPNRGGDIGRIASSRGLSRAALRRKLEQLYPRVIAIEYGTPNPRDIAFCSGSGNSAVRALAETGVDTLVTGELREEWFTYAQEQKLNLFLCGHYATEVHAVKALAAELSKKFSLPWEFIATENPL
jgi:dinuclear metal center YbgI/SA1388 family protein